MNSKNFKNIVSVIAVVIVVVIAIILSPEGIRSTFFQAGGGVSLKDMNKKDTTTMSVNLCLEANQTTRQNLEQVLFSSNYFKRQNGFYIGASAVAAVSTEYGVCCPVMFFNLGADFQKFRIEYKVGDFKRSSVATAGTDPQFSNFCTDLGEGASAKKAMQLSFINANTKFGFGHIGISSFYKFSDGNWYAYIEQVICGRVTLAGGVDFAEQTSGYAAAKAAIGTNSKVSLTANQMGTESQSFIATYNRDNIRVGKQKMAVSVSAWNRGTETGLHLIAALMKGKGTFFAQIGSDYCAEQLSPYCGLGTRFSF